MSPFDAPGVALRPDALLALRPEPERGATTASSPMPGPFPAPQKGQGHDLADLRAYTHGDDLRHIDPAATARTGELHMRQFRQDRDRALVLIADFRKPMLWGVTGCFRSHLAAQALIRAGWHAADREEQVGLVVISGAGVQGAPASAKRDAMVNLIRMMCEAHASALQAPQTPLLSDGLAQAQRTFPRHAHLLVASGFDGDDPALTPQLSALREHHDVQLVTVPHGLESGLLRGHYPLANGRIWNGAALG